MSAQTDIFRRLVRDRLGDPPVCLSSDATVEELAERMAAEAASCTVIVDENWRATGIITEQDVTRRIAFRVEPKTKVGDVMTTPVVTVERSDYLYHAVAFMRRRGLRHIPVVDEEQLVCGMLSLTEALAFLSEETIELIRLLTHEATLDGLKRVKEAQVDLAEALFENNVPVPEVQALLTDINHDIHRRILRRHLSEMADEKKWGEPPVPFSLIILGSGGRGENFLFPDQDNGFILGDYPDEEHARIDGFFIELATRMTRDLDAVGLPLCRGAIMATNPVWRKTASQWRAQITHWMTKRSTTMLRYSDIFFDFAHVYGDASLAAGLRDYVTAMAAKNPGFIKDMYSIEADHKVALGWFGRLMSERDSQDREGMINLKYGGTLPLVEGVRLLALSHGVAETSTLKRIDALHERGVLSANEQDYLAGAVREITRLLLRQQIADFKAGNEVTNFVPEAGLSDREKDFLVACFRAVEDLRGRLKSDFSGDIF
ncbi:MAG: DUF294 nucleotidyltransferase-like domain-containing protein [Hyphomicrobiales bacterium]|nr:DUF294 nucleotidyltransferase-like domain-containing protein [Hyphomicrobiales bacterium]